MSCVLTLTAMYRLEFATYPNWIKSFRLTLNISNITEDLLILDSTFSPNGLCMLAIFYKLLKYCRKVLHPATTIHVDWYHVIDMLKTENIFFNVLLTSLHLHHFYLANQIKKSNVTFLHMADATIWSLMIHDGKLFYILQQQIVTI